MNENKPLCFTCKHGLCLKQTERAVIISHEEKSPPKEEWQEPIEEGGEPREVELSSNGYAVLCFWHPEGSDAGPFTFEEVSECNRYEKKSAEKVDKPKK